MNFRFLGHLDTFAVAAQFHKLQPHNWKPNPNCEEMKADDLKHKTMILRMHNAPVQDGWLEDLPVHDRPALEKWTSMQRLLDSARRRIINDPVMRDMVDPAAPLGRIVISVMQKQSYIQMHVDLGDYAKNHVRFHVPLITNPMATVYAQNEQYHIPAGVLAHVNTQVPHWAGNWGDSWRSHLLFEMRRREAPVDD